MSKFRFIVLLCALAGFSVSVSAADSPVVSQEKSQVITLVSINSADAKTLAHIKGVGKKKAKEIIEYRSKNGSFRSVDDLLKIKCRGINKKWVDKMRKYLTV